METVSIYVLVDPRNNEIRYVGKTERELLIRLRDHIKEARSGKRTSWRNYWIAKLLRLGYRPSIQLVQEVPKTIWRTAEAYWIQYYWSIGCRLTNGTTGGEGKDHFTEATRAKMSESAMLKFANPVIKAKYLGNQNARGRELTPALRTNLTNGQFRRYGYPWENLKDDYERLGTCDAVAELYGCNTEVVRRNLAKAGVQTFQKRIPEWPNLERDYRELGSVRLVAEMYGVSEKRIVTQMRNRGIKTMPMTGRTVEWTDEWRKNHRLAVNDPEVQRRRIESKQRNPKSV